MGKCMPEGAHSFPAWAGQTNGKSTHSTDKAHKTNKSPGMGGKSGGSFPTAILTTLNHNNRTNLWVWCWGSLCPFPRSHSLSGLHLTLLPSCGIILFKPALKLLFISRLELLFSELRKPFVYSYCYWVPALESECLLSVAPLPSCSKALCVCFIQLCPNPNLSSAS